MCFHKLFPTVFIIVSDHLVNIFLGSGFCAVRMLMVREAKDIFLPPRSGSPLQPGEPSRHPTSLQSGFWVDLGGEGLAKLSPGPASEKFLKSFLCETVGRACFPLDTDLG